MPIYSGKLMLAGLISVVLLGILLIGAGFHFPDISRANPAWLIDVGGASVLLLIARGFLLRTMAPIAQRGGILRWVQLAARHQVIFSLFPAGIGDTSFPLLAKRIAELETPISLRIIAQVRSRDAIFIAMMGLVGMALVGLPVGYSVFAMLIALPLLYFIDEIVVIVMKTLTAIAPNSRIAAFLHEAALQEQPTMRDRLVRNALTALVWSFTIASVMAAFNVVGVSIRIGEALLFVAAVNVAGAVAFSIAGLGVSEAGAASALVISGYTIEKASSYALIVRPVLLISFVLAGLTLDIAITILRLNRIPADASTP